MSIMKSAQTVYYGPNISTYEIVGSVSAYESVTVKFREGNWYHIEYNVTGTSTKKRGYVPVSSVTLQETVGTYVDRDTNPLKCTVRTGGTTYTGPDPAVHVAAGSVSAGETIYDLGYYEEECAFIRYTVTSTGKYKRAYFKYNNISYN